MSRLGSPSRVEVEEQDILVLADLIGISRDEPEYLWIAKEAYNADLPVGWQIFFDDQGKHFYFDPKTETSTTQHPCIGYYQELYKDFKKQDAEFRKQQEAQELAMGLVEEGKKLQSQKKVVSGDDGEATSEDQRRDETAELTGQDPEDAAGDELFAKAKLLQAYSHDPNLASHYRRDMLEQDKRTSDMLKSILKREEDMFVQRLRIYVAKKEESARAPLETVLAEYAETSQSHVDEALQSIVSQMGELKKQMEEVKEAAQKGTPPKKNNDRDARMAKFSKMKGLESPVSGMIASPTSPQGRYLDDECDKCKEHEEKIKSLEEKVKDLEENGVVVKDKGAGEGGDEKDGEDQKEKDKERMEREKRELETKRELDDLRMKLAAANMKNKQQQEELQKLKTFVASSMVQEIDADESRGRMDQLSLEARRHDALGWEEESRPGTSAGVSRPGTSGSVGFAADPSRPGTSGTAGSASTTATGFAERFTASGMTADVMIQVLEKVEALSAEGKGPIHQIRTDKENLLAQVKQLEEEVERWKAHSEHVDEQNKQHVLSLAKMEAQKSEIVRAKEHSEHMEFLAQQYADQVQNLQGMLRKLRDQVTQSQLTIDANKEAAKKHALAHGTSNSAITSAEKGKNAFSVRVRSSTILDVKRCTSTLRSAINLLRIDFQSYAEGIFLPLARELQQSTLYLATSLSAKARELRFCTNSLSLAFASQRLLEDKLHAVYKVSFHSLVYLRELEDDEQNNFRTPTPRNLTMQLKNGFENKRETLEIYEFEKVLAPDNDPVTIFQELTPFFARIFNWESACLVISGGRFSKKEDLVNGTDAIDENGKKIKLPSVFEQAIEYVSHIYKNEKDKLQKARLTDSFDLQIFQEYSEVLDEETMHYIAGAAKESEEAGGEGGKISLVDMQQMLATSSNKKGSDRSRSGSRTGGSRAASASKGGKEGVDGNEAKEEGDGKEAGENEQTNEESEDEDIPEDDDEHEEQPDGANVERQVFVPTYQLNDDENVTVQCLNLLKDARNRSEGRLNIKQQELDRNGSEKVQRAKRLAKKGSRNELGELMQEPHKVFSLMVVKRDRRTNEEQTVLLKIVLLGSPAEREDPSSEVCKFRVEDDQSRHTLTQYFERKYLRQTDVNMKLNDSALRYLPGSFESTVSTASNDFHFCSNVLQFTDEKKNSDLIWDSVDSNSGVVLLSCVSPCIDHFDTTIADLRYACMSRKERPTTAARLERVKFRWQNQSAAWAFTLWKGAVADAVQIQLNHEIDNLTEEMNVLKSDNTELKDKLQRMAYDGVEYMSDGDKEESDNEHVEDTDVLAQQRQLLEKAIGKELLKLKEKQEGAVMQTVIAKMRYAQSKQSALVANNRALARMLHRERGVSRVAASSPSRDVTRSGRSHDQRRSHSAMGAMGPGLDRSLSASAPGGLLPPLSRGGQQAWGDSNERASKKQATGRGTR